MTVCINGTFVTNDAAPVSVFDRGFPFGDGVYEVTAVIGGHLVDADRHLDRLFRSLSKHRLRTKRWSPARRC